MTFISGNTYPVRHLIKPLGFTWNKTLKQWERTLPLNPYEEETLTALRGIIIADQPTPTDNIRYTDNRTFKQRFGHCEDAPCCGCCGNDYFSRQY